MDGWSMINAQTPVESAQSPVINHMPVSGHESETIAAPARSESGDRRLATTSARVLIADDQPDVLEALRLLLKGEGYRIDSVGSPAAILETIDSIELDAVLMDLN